MDEAAIKALVEEVARDQFHEVAVERVDVELDQDADGDPVWRVLLVLSATDKLEARKLSGFLRHLFARYDDDRFPLLTFRSAADDRRTRSAAA